MSPPSLDPLSSEAREHRRKRRELKQAAYREANEQGHLVMSTPSGTLGPRSTLAELDPASLSPMLRETFGHGLSSPMTPVTTPVNTRREQFPSGAPGVSIAAGDEFLQDAEVQELLRAFSSATKDSIAATSVTHGADASPPVVTTKGAFKQALDTAAKLATGDRVLVDKTLWEKQQQSSPSETSSASAASAGITKPEPVASTNSSTAAANGPDVSTYVKMLEMGVPREAVLQRMARDGVDGSFLPGDVVIKTVASGHEGGGLEATDATGKAGLEGDDGGPRLKDHEVYGRFFRMLKVGIPASAVKLKMLSEGIHPEILDLDPAGPGSRCGSPCGDATIAEGLGAPQEGHTSTGHSLGADCGGAVARPGGNDLGRPRRPGQPRRA